MSLLVSHSQRLSSKVLPSNKIFVTALSTKASSGKCFNGKKTGQQIKNKSSFFISASYLQF
jgi:hypothetical protein